MYLYFLYQKLYKPILLYKHRYFSIRNLTSSIQNHTQIPYTHISIQIFIVSILKFHSSLLKFHSSLPVISFFLLFFFLFFFFFFLSLLFSLIDFCSLFLQDQNEIFILVLSLFDLIPFLFHFPRRKLSPSFLQATCLFHKFLPYFILISFFYYSLVLTFIFILNSIYQNPTLAYELIKL